MKRSLLCSAVAGALLLAGCGDDEGASSATTAANGGGGQGQGGMTTAAGGSGGAGATGGTGGCRNSLATDETLPDSLSETGLYADIAAKTVADHARSFSPQYELWSDDADKSRWVYLPECDVIDTSNMDDWSFPVGTRFWKEFRLGTTRIETRMIERTGQGPNDFAFTSYLWNAQGTEATRVPEGVIGVNGTDYNVPSETQCRQCHGSYSKGGGRPSRALGFSATQLAGGSGLSLANLVAAGHLSHPPTNTSFAPPGSTPEIRDALGYLHANCGHCHNATADKVAAVDLDFWLTFSETDVLQTGAYRTAVSVPTSVFGDPQVTARVEPGDHLKSAVWFRMNQRGNNAQMPPVGSAVSDAQGLSTIQTWIGTLP